MSALGGDYDYLEGTRESILLCMYKLCYKNGAFKDHIFKNTPVVDALDILVRSPLTTHEEKGKILTFRKHYITMEKAGRKAPSPKNLIPFQNAWLKLDGVYKVDAKARGQYIPPFTFQILNKDGTIKETHTLNDDGTETITKGGIPRMPAGAPQSFLDEEAETIKRFDQQAKTSNAKCIVGQQISLGNVPDGPKKTGTMHNATSLTKIDGEKEGSKESKDDNTDFGKAFSKKVRGAFM